MTAIGQCLYLLIPPLEVYSPIDRSIVLVALVELPNLLVRSEASHRRLQAATALSPAALVLHHSKVAIYNSRRNVCLLFCQSVRKQTSSVVPSAFSHLVLSSGRISEDSLHTGVTLACQLLVHPLFVYARPRV